MQSWVKFSEFWKNCKGIKYDQKCKKHVSNNKWFNKTSPNWLMPNDTHCKENINVDMTTWVHYRLIDWNLKTSNDEMTVAVRSEVCKKMFDVHKKSVIVNKFGYVCDRHMYFISHIIGLWYKKYYLFISKCLLI